MYASGAHNAHCGHGIRILQALSFQWHGLVSSGYPTFSIGIESTVNSAAFTVLVDSKGRSDMVGAVKKILSNITKGDNEIQSLSSVRDVIDLID